MVKEVLSAGTRRPLETFEVLSRSIYFSLMHPVELKIHPSIHYILGRVAVAAGYSRRPSPPATLPAPPGGADIIPPASSGSATGSPPSWLCPEVPSEWRRPGGILIRCPNHLSWLLVPAPHCSPASLQRTLSRILDLFLVATQSS